MQTGETSLEPARRAAGLEAPAPGLEAPAPWRAHVLDRMLSMAALISPPLVALAMFVRSSPRSKLDVAVLGSMGLLLPALALARRTPVTLRAFAVVGIIFATTLYTFARIGFGAGVSVALLAACVLAVIYLGRRLGFLIIGLAALAIVAVGLLVTRGVLVLLPGEVDPYRLQNWVRMAGTTSLIALLLAAVIDSVIFHAEASARSATEALAELRLAYEHLGQVTDRLEAAKEEERSFLSNELHDELAQTLATLKLRLQIGARASKATAGAGGDGMADTLALVDQLIARVRKMSGDLRPPLLDEVGLLPALRAYLEGQSALSGIAIDLDASDAGSSGPMPPDLEIACFRVVQESITNVLRHASAGRIRVRAVRASGRMSLTIRDDGRGFDPATLDLAAAAGHLGVVGMRERVRARGGVFALRSLLGEGTTVDIELPIPGVRAGGAQAESGAAIPIERAARLVAIGAWRENVRSGMLTVAAVVTPLLAALGLFVGPPRRDLIDVVVLTATGVLLPAIRLARGLAVAARVRAAIAVLFGAGVFILARAGFGTGVSVLLVATCAIGIICLARGFGLALIGLSALAHVAIGLLVTRHVLIIDPSEVDPSYLQNWIRMAVLVALLATLIATVIDFVISHIEANARAATSALGELRLAYQRLGRLHGRLEAAKEEERRFLAHELHDELGQTLTAIKLRVQLGSRDSAVAGTAAGVEGAADALGLIDRLIAQVRRMSGDLRPPLLDEVGLFPALRAYVESQMAASGVAIELEAREGDAGRLPPDLEIACFRVVQESIANALRHAGTPRVRVRVKRSASGISLSIADEGQGFDTATLDTATASGHLGVVGMRERVRARGGAFRIDSRPGAGTTVAIDLPLAP